MKEQFIIRYKQRVEIGKRLCQSIYYHHLLDPLDKKRYWEIFRDSFFEETRNEEAHQKEFTKLAKKQVDNEIKGKSEEDTPETSKER